MLVSGTFHKGRNIPSPRMTTDYTPSGDPIRLDPPPRIALIRTSHYPALMNALTEESIKTLIASGIPSDQITSIVVPGSFEIPLAAKHIAEKKDVDGIISLGIIVDGETHHASHIARATTDGLMHVQLAYGIPIAHGILHVMNLKQAEKRCVGVGNRGAEAARALLEMIVVLRGE